MSKLLVQSKTFVPMVIQKSTTEAARILENHPSLAAKEPAIAFVTVAEQVTKHEIDDTIVIQQNLKMSKEIAMASMTIPKAIAMDLAQLHERLLLLWARGHLWVTGARRGLLRTLPVTLGTPSQLLWMEGGPRTVARDEAPASSSAAPPTIAPETGKRRPVHPAESRLLLKKRESAIGRSAGKSNLWEVILSRSPAWQSVLASNLGRLQKTVVQKLSK